MTRSRNKKTEQRRPVTKPVAAQFSVMGRSVTLPTGIQALALCLLICVAFIPAIGAGFVWDDDAFTLAEPVQRLSGLWQIWLEPTSIRSEVHYWPLLYTTFWLEHKLWGFNPLGYHLVNLLLHAAVTLLLWRLLRRLAVPGAWFAAAVFAVHPVHVEPVAWVIGRKDVLAALLFLAAAWFYIRGVVEQRTRRDYALAVALFVLGLLTKSMVITLPAALLIWHWWKQGRVRTADFTQVLPFLLLGMSITLFDWWYYAARETLATDYSLSERVLIAAHALWFYTGKLFWPMQLMVIYPHWDVGVSNPVAWMYLVAAVALALTLWFARHRIGRGPFAGALFFAVTLSPVLGLIDYGYMQFSFAADRYQYLASAAVIAVCVGAAARARTALSSAPGAGVLTRATPVLAGLVLAALGLLTWQQAGIYKDAGAFFGHIIAHNPQARSAHYNLGNWLQGQARFAEALDAYAIAARQDPDASYIPANMAVALEALGRRDEAEAQLRHALQLKPNDTTAMNNLATLLTRQRQYREALALYREVLNIDPASAKAWSGMSIPLFALNRSREAFQSLDRALALDPSHAEARAIRERVLQRMGSDADPSGK